jgi:PmbA protein
MKDLLSKAAGLADQAELFTQTSEEQSVTFQANKLKDISRSESHAQTLRLIKDGKMGSAQSSKPGSDDDLLRYAADTVAFGSPVDYKWQGASELAKPGLFDPRVESVTEAEMLSLASDMVSALNRFDPGIMAMAGVSKAVVEYALGNSAGFSGSERMTQWSMYFGGELVNDDGFLFIYDQLAGTSLLKDTEQMKHNVIESFRLARNNVALASGQYPVIFAPREVSCLINPLLACLNGKAVSQGVSPLKSRLGDLVFDPRISLRDDAHIDGAVGSRSFDREGIATRPHALVDKGVVHSFLLDLQSAAELKMAPTGNGGLNGPAANNVVLAPGDLAYTDMLKDIEEGVLIDMTMGAWAGNPYGGQVSGNISLGYKIEKGRLVGRIKDAMFSVNVFKALAEQLHSLSREQVWHGNNLFPYVRLNDVNVSTKQ